MALAFSLPPLPLMAAVPMLSASAMARFTWMLPAETFAPPALGATTASALAV